jgi:hypothetical protein
MWVLPAGAISADLNSWKHVSEGLQLGMNPYARSRLLNWPPFWMEVIYFCTGVSTRTGWDFVACLRGVLIVADLAVLALTFGLLRLLDGRSSHWRLLLVGYCLNPLLVLLTVQHCNFDAFAEFWIVLMLICLIRFRRRGEEIDYLLAAACLGMAAFTKTFPLMLFPVLAPGARMVSGRIRWLAAALALGPIALALAPIYVLSPAEIVLGVIRYRSFGANFGVLGLLNVLHLEPPADVYGKVFTCVFLVGLLALAVRLWRWGVARDEDLVLLTVIILLSSMTLGPGYGSQYWFWVVPLLLVVYQQYKSLRVLLVMAAVIIVGTNIFEYAILPSLGRFLVYMNPSVSSLEEFGDKLVSSDVELSKLRLAMTLASLVVLAAAIGAVRRREHNTEHDGIISPP